MSLKPLQQQGILLEWTAWKIPANANPPGKPEGYGEEAKLFIGKLLEETGLIVKAPSKKFNTYLAHIGAKYAKTMGRFNEYHKRIFQAVWERDEDIESVDVLATIATEVGLDAIEFKEALRNKDYIDMVETDFEDAYKNKIWTIPSYSADSGQIQVNHFEDLPSLNELKGILS